MGKVVSQSHEQKMTDGVQNFPSIAMAVEEEERRKCITFFFFTIK